MRRQLTGLPPLVIPTPYALRTFTPTDVDAWRRLLARTGDLGEWTLERGQRFFEPDSGMPLDAAYFLTLDGDPIATAQLHLHDHGPYAPMAELGWVAVDREHRGQGLGRVVSLAVLRKAADLGHAELFLRTDDHRLAAIRTYLSLGFVPWMYDDSAPARWQKLLEEVAPG
jgi:mycothiol synthase